MTPIWCWSVPWATSAPSPISAECSAAPTGKSWTQTLFVDSATGVEKLARAYDRPNVIIATTMRHYNAPNPTPNPGRAGPQTGPTGTRVYRSTDEGLTWQEITEAVCPASSGEPRWRWR